MLHEFLSDNRLDLIAQCRAKVAKRAAPAANEPELANGITVFLNQLIKTLRVEQNAAAGQASKDISGPSGGENPVFSEIGETAAEHGRELLRHGFTVDQLVHDYGDLCQAVTELAFERGADIETDEFRTLNRCLDNAIAGAVTEYAYQRDVVNADAQADALNERLGFFTHELRNLVSVATLALAAIRTGSVGFGGATSAVLDNSLIGLRHLIDRSLTDVRMMAGMAAQPQLFSLAAFVAEVRASTSLEAKVREAVLVVAPVDPDLALDADRHLLLSAVGNLVQNAIKYTHRGTEVVLSAYAAGNRVLIDVKDRCGGLPPNFAEIMFRPFMQGSEDRSGLGLGLSISRRGVEASGGTLSVRDVPGTGCVFTIDLPRFAMPKPDRHAVAAVPAG